MNPTKNLKEFCIVYRIITPDGIIGISYLKYEIEAKNKEAAIQALRNTLSEDDVTIRIDKIEHLNQKEQVKPKRKRSALGWIALGVICAGFLSRLVSKLF